MLILGFALCFLGSSIKKRLSEQFPSLSIGCFIKKPVTMENLFRRVKAELE